MNTHYIQMKKRLFALMAPLVLFGCEIDPDAAELAEYRAAIPSAERLSMDTPSDGEEGALSLSGDANFATLGDGLTLAMNLSAYAMVRTLEAVVELPPTTFDAEEEEAVWGPFDNDDGVGQALVYIRKNAPNDDFEFSYAFVRLPDSDAEDADGEEPDWTAVIVGAATPDAEDEDRGVGLTVWDFEANRAFEEEHNTEFDDGELTAGRFVQVYGVVADDDADADAEFAFNYGMFWEFQGEDMDEALNGEAFFARYATAGTDEEPAMNVRSLEVLFQGDYCDESAACFDDNGGDSVLDEELRVHKAFLNEGIGRAEISVAEGDLDEESASAIECWDGLQDIEYLSIEAPGDVSLEVSEMADCSSPFEASLSDLEIPSLSDLDSDDRESVRCVAEQGIEACDQ